MSDLGKHSPGSRNKSVIQKTSVLNLFCYDRFALTHRASCLNAAIFCFTARRWRSEAFCRKGGRMRGHSEAAWEQAMKVREIILRAMGIVSELPTIQELSALGFCCGVTHDLISSTAKVGRAMI